MSRHGGRLPGREKRCLEQRKTSTAIGDAMFNRDGIFGKKDENPPRTNDTRPVNVTHGLSGGGTSARSQPVETPKPEARLTEPPKAPARDEQTTGSRLIVGPDIKLKGVEITDCDTLV